MPSCMPMLLVPPSYVHVRERYITNIILPNQDLVEGVLALLGLKPDAVSDADSLANLGIDSMQLMEVPAWAPLPNLAPALHTLSGPQRTCPLGSAERRHMKGWC